MKTYRTSIIAGAAALVALIITIAVLSSGNAGSGLYISSVSGDVNISNPKSGVNEAAAIDRELTDGDVVTVNNGASCKLVYRSKYNLDDNYMVLEPLTQVFATGKYTGKADGELYLNRGAVFVTSLTECKANIIVRTASSSYTTANTVMRISYETGDETSSTTAVSFAGNSEINLYDKMGNIIDKDGYKLQSAKPDTLLSGRCASVIGSDPPAFFTLNVPTELSSHSASTLRELLTASNFGELAFSPADIKTAYDNAPAPGAALPPESEPAVTTTAEEFVPADVTVSAETSVTEEPEVTTVPEETTAESTAATTRVTTVQTTTAAPVTTTTAATTAAQKLITVYIIVEDEIITQEVPYGSDASKPSVPEIPGKRFIGWDGDFTNITKETTITAIFEDDSSYSGETTGGEDDLIDDGPDETTTAKKKTHKVTISINGKTTTQDVEDGGTAKLPDVNVPGYVFLGWDGDPFNVTSDRTITAILAEDPSFAQTTAFDPFSTNPFSDIFTNPFSENFTDPFADPFQSGPVLIG